MSRRIRYEAWRNRRRPLLIGLAYAWVLLVSLVLLWQLIAYRGIMASLIERQFDAFGQSFPVFTYLLLLAVLASPGALLYAGLARPEIEGGDRRKARMILRRTFSYRLLQLASGILLVAAVMVLLQLLSFPSAGGAARRIDVSAAESDAQVVEGPVVLEGTMRYDRMATMEELFVTGGRQHHFVPAVSSLVPSTVRFFIEVGGPVGHGAVLERRQGILRRNALPGEIATLYRGAGYTIASPNYVLYRDRAAMRAPSLVLAAELAALSLLPAVAAMLMRSRLRRISGSVRPVEATTA